MQDLSESPSFLPVEALEVLESFAIDLVHLNANLEFAASVICRRSPPPHLAISYLRAILFRRI